MEGGCTIVHGWAACYTTGMMFWAGLVLFGIGAGCIGFFLLWLFTPPDDTHWQPPHRII